MPTARFLRRQVKKNPSVTAKTLQQDFVATGIEILVCTVRCTPNAEGFHARSPRHTPLLSHEHKKIQLQYAQNHINKPQKHWDSALWSGETKVELFGLMDLEEKE